MDYRELHWEHGIIDIGSPERKSAGPQGRSFRGALDLHLVEKRGVDVTDVTCAHETDVTHVT